MTGIAHAPAQWFWNIWQCHSGRAPAYRILARRLLMSDLTEKKLSDNAHLAGKSAGSAPADRLAGDDNERDSGTPKSPSSGSWHGDKVDPPAGTPRRESMQEQASESGSMRAPVPDRCERVFAAFSHIAPLILVLALLLQTWPDFWHALSGRAYFCPPEAQTVTVFMNSSAHSTWLAPQAPGLVNAMWPGFIWYLGLIAALGISIPEISDLVFPLANTVAGALLLLGVWALARAAGFNRKACLAGALIMLCSPMLIPLGHFTNPATLAAALLIFALLFFCLGWQKESSWICLPAGFILTALATLTGGVFHLILPLAASLVYLLWTGSYRRAQRADAILGFVLMLLIFGAWLGAVMLYAQPRGYLSSLTEGMLNTVWDEGTRFWLPAAVAGILTLPWLLSVLCVSWHKVALQAPMELKASRLENAGASFIWICLGVGVTLSVLTPPWPPQITAMALAAIAAPLLGKTLVNLSNFGSRLFFLICSLIFIILGFVTIGLHFNLSHEFILSIFPHDLPQRARFILLEVSAVPLIGIICLLGGLVMLRFVVAYRHASGVLFCTILAIILCQPAQLLLVPQLAASPDSPLRTLAQIEKGALPSESGTSAQQSDDSAIIPPEKMESGLPAQTEESPVVPPMETSDDRGPDADASSTNSPESSDTGLTQEQAQ